MSLVEAMNVACMPHGLLDRAAWLAERRKGIGGSDVAAILGLSEWASALDIYLEKTGQAEPKQETKRMRRGSALEPLILQRFEERFGVPVERQSGPLVSSRHEFMRANLDGRIPGAAGQIVEAKCAWSSAGWGDDGTADVPAYYQTQACHYFEVADADVCFFPVLFGQDGLDWQQTDTAAGPVWTPKIAEDADFRIYQIERDESFVRDVIEAEREFWFGHVVPRVPPSPATRDDAAKLWSRDAGTSIDVSDDIHEKVCLLKSLRATAKEIEEREGAIVDALTVAFGDAAAMKFGGEVIATYKTQKRKSYTVKETEFRKLLLK